MPAPDPQHPRRQFRLPADDEAFLNSLGLTWETLCENGQRWVIAYDEKTPCGYNVEKVDVAIMMAPGYPPGPLDMAYFSPPLVRTNGVAPCRAEGRVQIDGKQWQGWSRHRTPADPWLPGEDNLESHYFYMQSWLTFELKR